MKKIKKLLSTKNFQLFGFSASQLQKLLAIFVVTCFFATSVCHDAIAVMAIPAQDATQYNQIFTDFILPYSYGKINRSHFAGTDRVIINIQDLHCHPKVQKNISNIIEMFDNKYGVTNIYLEGAYGDVSTKLLTENIKDSKKKTEILNKILDTGKLTGAEYYSASSNKTEIIKGLEKKEPYLDNLKRFGDLLEKQDEIQVILKGIEESTKKIKKQYYTKIQYKIENLSKKYMSGEIRPEKYYRTLQKYTEKLGIDLTKYENIRTYMMLLSLQKRLNYKAIASQFRSFVAGLKGNLPYDTYKMLLDNTKDFKQTDKLYSYIIKLSRDYGLDLTVNFEELNKYFNYIELSQKINQLDLLKEQEKLTNEINTRFSDTVTQKEVVFLTQFEKYLKDYMSTKITSDDYEYYKENIETYKKLYNKHIDNKIFSLLKPYMDEVDTFYKINSDRNEYFTQNLFDGIEARKIENIKEEPKEINKIIENMGQVKRVDVVVTGGFHSKTVTEILQKQGISYIVITPNVKDGIVDAEKTYYQIAKEQKEIDFQTLAPMPLVLLGKDAVIEVMLDTNNNIKRNEIVEIYGESAVKNVENKIKKGESGFSAKEELKQLSIDTEKRRTEISKLLESDDIDTEVLELITEVILTSLSSSNVNNLKKTDIDIVIQGVIKAINNEYPNNIFIKIINILTSNGKRNVELENIKDVIIQIMQSPFLDSFLEQAGKNYLGYDTQKGLYYEISLGKDSKKRIYLQDFEKIILLFLVSYEGQEASPIEKTTKFLSYASNEEIVLFAEQADIFQKNFAKLEDVKELKPESVNIINSINTINEGNTYKGKTYSVRNIQKAIQTAQANGVNLSEEEISKIIEIIRISLLSKINDVKAEYRPQFLKDIQSLGRLYTEQNEIIIYIDNDSLNEGIDIGIGTEILKEIKKNKLVEEDKLNAGITKIKFVMDPSVKQKENSIKELLGVFWNDNFCAIEPMVKNDIEAIKKKNYYDTRRIMIFEDRAISEIEKTLPYTILRQNYDEEGVIYLKGAQNRKGNKSELFNEKNNIVYILSADIDGTLTAVSDSRLIFLTELEEKIKNGKKVSQEERIKTFLLFNSLGYLDELKMPIAHRMQVCKDISEQNETYIISGRNDGGKNIETTEQYFLQNGVPFNQLILKPLDKLQPTIKKEDGKFEGFIIDEFEKRLSRAEDITKNNPGTVVVINVFDDRQDSVDFYKSKKEELEKNGIENIIINVFQPQPRGVFKAKLKAHLKDKYSKYDFKKPENIINLIEEINQVYNLQLTREEILQIKLNIYRKQPIGSDIKNEETQERLQLVLKIITDIQQSADNSYLSEIKDIWNDNYSNYGEIEDITILTNGFQNKPPVKIKTVAGEEYFLQYVEEEHKGNERDDMTFEIENIAADNELAVPIIKTNDGKLYVKYVEDETPGTPAQTYFVAVNKFNNGEFYNKNLENNSHSIKDIVISITNLIIDFDNELTKKIYNNNLTNKWSQHADIIALNDENYRFQDNKTFEEKGRQLKKQLGYSDSIGTDKQIGQLFFIVDGDYNPKRAEDRLKILFKKENNQVLEMAINSMEDMFENYGKYNYNGLDKHIVCGDTNLANVVYDNKSNKPLFTNFKNAGRNYRAKAYSDFLADARYPQLFDVQNIKTIIQTAQANGANLTKEEIVQIVEFTRYYAISRIPYMLEKNKSRKDEYLTNLNALNAGLIEELTKNTKYSLSSTDEQGVNEAGNGKLDLGFGKWAPITESLMLFISLFVPAFRENFIEMHNYSYKNNIKGAYKDFFTRKTTNGTERDKRADIQEVQYAVNFVSIFTFASSLFITTLVGIVLGNGALYNLINYILLFAGLSYPLSIVFHKIWNSFMDFLGTSESKLDLGGNEVVEEGRKTEKTLNIEFFSKNKKKIYSFYEAIVESGLLISVTIIDTLEKLLTGNLGNDEYVGIAGRRYLLLHENYKAAVIEQDKKEDWQVENPEDVKNPAIIMVVEIGSNIIYDTYTKSNAQLRKDLMTFIRKLARTNKEELVSDKDLQFYREEIEKMLEDINKYTKPVKFDENDEKNNRINKEINTYIEKNKVGENFLLEEILKFALAVVTKEQSSRLQKTIEKGLNEVENKTIKYSIGVATGLTLSGISTFLGSSNAVINDILMKSLINIFLALLGSSIISNFKWKIKLLKSQDKQEKKVSFYGDARKASIENMFGIDGTSKVFYGTQKQFTEDSTINMLIGGDLDLGWFEDVFKNKPTARAIFVGIIESVLLVLISLTDSIEKTITEKQIGRLGQWFLNKHTKYVNAVKTLEQNPNDKEAEYIKRAMEQGLTKVENITAVAAIAASISMATMFLTGTSGYSATDAGIFITAITFIVNMITHAINNIWYPETAMDIFKKVLSYNELIKELVNSIANAFQGETPDGLVYLAKTAEQAEAANKYIQDNNIEKAIVILIDNEIDENGNLTVKTSKLRGGKLINDSIRISQKTDKKIMETIAYTKGEQTKIKIEDLAEEMVNNLKGSNPVVNLIDIDTDKKSEEIQKEIIKRTNNAIQTDEYHNGFEFIIDATEETNITNNIVNWQKMGATVILTNNQIEKNKQKIEETGLQFTSEDDIFEFENITLDDLKTISNSGKKSLKNSRKIVKITGKKLPNEKLLEKANAQNIIFALKADKFNSDISNCILISDETTEKDSLQKALNSGMVSGVLTSADTESMENLTDILTRIANKDFVKNIKEALKIISTMIERMPVQKYERAKNTILKTKTDTGKIVLTNNLQNKGSILYKLLNQKVSELNELDNKQIDEIKDSIQKIISNNLFNDTINYSLQMKLDNGEIFEALGEIKGLAMLAMQEIAMEYLTRNGRNETEIRKQLNAEYSQTRDYMAEAMLQFVMNKNGDITQFGKTFKGSANIGKLTPEQLENNVARMVTSGIPLLEYDNGQVGEYSEERTIENIGKIIYVFDLLLPDFDDMDTNLDAISVRETKLILSAA